MDKRGAGRRSFCYSFSAWRGIKNKYSTNRAALCYTVPEFYGSAPPGEKNFMKIIENERFGQERALYRSDGVLLKNCRFEGKEDGESALKESRSVAAEHCYMDLRYPFWHVRGLRLSDSELTERCRAALWYDENIAIRGCTMNGIKALRECRGVALEDTEAHSPEFGWRCRDIEIKHSTVESEYAFFESRNINAEGLRLTGKYTFQYTKNVRISRSVLNTKDAFWHAKNVTVTDSEIDGEYLGWYSEGLTLVRCHIKGTQPLCYCKNLRLVDCTTENCDLAFEYSDVRADIRGGIDSNKNPRRGVIRADSVGEIIRTEDSVYPSRARILLNNTGK